MKNRYNYNTHQHETDKKVDSFINDLLKVYNKHKMSLGHEDSHGAFIVMDLSKENIDWINDAAIMFSEKSKYVSKKPKTTVNNSKPKFKFYKLNENIKS